VANRELFEDSPIFLAYGQRTADGRIVWGGCGAPYWFASRPPASPMRSPAFAERLRALLVRRFPVLKDIQVTHNWGGVPGGIYDDHALGVMTKNERGKLFVSKVTLRPRIAFSAAKQPSAAELAELHHHAHEECFIANSVLTEVQVSDPPDPTP